MKIKISWASLMFMNVGDVGPREQKAPLIKSLLNWIGSLPNRYGNRQIRNEQLRAEKVVEGDLKVLTRLLSKEVNARSKYKSLALLERTLHEATIITKVDPLSYMRPAVLKKAIQQLGTLQDTYGTETPDLLFRMRRKDRENEALARDEARRKSSTRTVAQLSAKKQLEDSFAKEDLKYGPNEHIDFQDTRPMSYGDL
jgi:hypothetical protein